MPKGEFLSPDWSTGTTIPSRKWTCGYCERQVGGNVGWTAQQSASIYICPACNAPTFFDRDGRQYPQPLPGHAVDHLPADVEGLLAEARRAVQAKAYTASIMACRKVLAHIAVEKGAPQNRGFKDYVAHLDQNGFIPPGGRTWVDYVKDRGNEANHEIMLFEKEDAEGVLKFTGALLRFVYELPNSVPKP